MPETTIKLLDIIIGGAATLFAFLWGLLAWNGNRLVNRVDSHEEKLTKKVDKADHIEAISELRHQLDQHNNRVLDKIDESNTAINNRIEKLTAAVYTRRRGEKNEE